MKKLSILFTALLFVFIYSCGGGTEKKEEKKEEIKKETKKFSKETKEGMMAILDASGIEVPSELEFEKVEKKSNDYIIRFKKDSVSEELRQKLDEWYINKITSMDESGWKKMNIHDNTDMGSFVFNQNIMYPPKDKDIDVSYGLSLSTKYNKEEHSYKFSVSAD